MFLLILYRYMTVTDDFQKTAALLAGVVLLALTGLLARGIHYASQAEKERKEVTCMKASKATFLLGIFFLIFLVLDPILALNFFNLSQDLGFLLAGLSVFFWAYCLKRREG